MIHRTYNWTTKDNNRTLFAQCWKPETDSDTSILLIHGLGEHSGRYERWAELFVEKGYNFLSFDLRGHGKSSGKRGHAKSMQVLLNDIDFFFSKTKRLFPGTKFILYGHSMGGNLALNHIILRNHPVSALIVTSPWLKLKQEPPKALISIVNFLKKLFPALTIPNGLNAEDISHDPEVVRNYTSDPLNHNKISLKLFSEIYKGGYFVLRNVYKINTPFLLMHGTEDKITSPQASENFVMNTSERTHLKLWEGQYHELHNELIYKEVFEYIINWLKSHNL
jgi:alpha-beta hydrolase superfamily lysophospholipase